MKNTKVNDNKYLMMIDAMRLRKKKNILRKVKLGTLFSAVVVILVLFCSFNVTFGKVESDFDCVKVKKGDTLWTIAERSTHDKDIREVLYEIKEINNIDGNIKPGDIIKVPN